jgi:EmrB/QacA subfamily drug resistance transporter
MMESSIKAGESRRKGLALAVIVAAQFMVVLDIAIVNVALPAIKGDLHFAQANLQWVISAYAILFGGVLLLGGRLADVFGRRRVFMLGLAVFSASSLLCGVSWSEGSLIGFRALQGLGGALFAPAGLSILMTTFVEGPERNRALGIWGAASGSGGAAGVLLGGLLTSYLSWSWVFFINVPVGIAVIVATPLLLAESRGQDHSHFDVAGATSVTAAVMLLVYAMTRATQEGWASVPTLSLLGASAALLAAFVAIELRSPSPLLPMRMFRNRMLSAANATAAVIGAIAFSEFFLLTLYMQQVLGYSAIQTGVGFAAITFTIIVFSNVAQTLVTRFGVRIVLAAGLTLDAAALAAFTQLPVGGRYFWNLFPAFLISGAGLALSFVPVTIAGLAGVRRADAGIASGLINTSRQVGGAVGLAAVTTIVASYASNGGGATGLARVAAVDGGLTHGFQVGFTVLAGVAVLGAMIAAVLLRPQAEGMEVQPLLTSPSSAQLEEAV